MPSDVPAVVVDRGDVQNQADSPFVNGIGILICNYVCALVQR